MFEPELVRKGRFDEIFFVDLPKPESEPIFFEFTLKVAILTRKASILQKWPSQATGFRVPKSNRG